MNSRITEKVPKLLGKEFAVVLQRIPATESTYHRWRKGYDVMGRDEMKHLKERPREYRATYVDFVELH